MIKKYLIIRLSSIGDIVLTSPVIRCLKLQVPESEIHFVTKQKNASIVLSNPYVDKVHLFSDNLNELILRLEEEHFDFIIDLHKNLRSNRIKNRLKVPSSTFKKLNFEKYLLVNFKLNRLPKMHVVDRYLETLSVFNVENDQKGLDFFIPPNEEIKMEELPSEYRKGYVAFVIAGTWATKKLPVAKVLEVCHQIEFPVVLLGGEFEEANGEKIFSQSKGNVLNFVGKLSLNQSASLVKNARVVLTNDTGLMHVAAAFKKKILSFWGNTIPGFGMYPYFPHPDSKVIEIEGLSCRPCSKLGYRACPNKHFRCMEEIEVGKIVEWVNIHYMH